MLSAELEILEHDGMRSDFKRSIKKIATRICVERAREFAMPEKSLTQLHLSQERRVMPSALLC
jgi:hypothetical protein